MVARRLGAQKHTSHCGKASSYGGQCRPGARFPQQEENRRRLEKLQADGPLSFVELQTPEELDTYYDEIIDFYDFRTGAIHGQCPFRDDPRKRAFFRALMAQGGLLHVCVMKVGEQLVSAHIGIRNKTEMMAVLVGHSPFLAVYSPANSIPCGLDCCFISKGSLAWISLRAGRV